VARQSGFAYLFLLFFIALMAVSALALGTVAHYARIRSDEAELLRIGGEFRRALAGYRDAANPRVYPTSLDDLLLDRRSGIQRRHLRKVYVDPITRQREWGLVTEAGRIVGVHSLSARKPLKVSGFDPLDGDFELAEHYSEWVFQPASGVIALPRRPAR